MHKQWEKANAGPDSGGDTMGGDVVVVAAAAPTVATAGGYGKVVPIGRCGSSCQNGFVNPAGTHKLFGGAWLCRRIGS